MTDTAAPQALLPTGLRDVLPPDAAHEAGVAERMMALFAGNGYERVKPPLVEFEDSLLAGPGAAMASQTFRIMDPLSQRMMGLRADMTLQVARIAVTRLGKAPRPLRLCYSGQVLRVKGHQLHPARQFAQVGTELIGAASAAADAEAVLLAVEALADLGIQGISVDLSLPTLVPCILANSALDGAAKAALRDALDHKDAASVAQKGGDVALVLGKLVEAAGPADRALGLLNGLDLPQAAAHERAHLAEVLALIRHEAPHLAVTVDPVENRGFEYHSGVSFTLFAKGQGGELGRGGRYLAGECEPATGFTLFMDALLAAMKPVESPARLYVPLGIARSQTVSLRASGWVIVAGLAPCADATAEARRLGCSHRFEAGQPVAV